MKKNSLYRVLVYIECLQYQEFYSILSYFIFTILGFFPPGLTCSRDCLLVCSAEWTMSSLSNTRHLICFRSAISYKKYYGAVFSSLSERAIMVAFIMKTIRFSYMCYIASH